MVRIKYNSVIPLGKIKLYISCKMYFRVSELHSHIKSHFYLNSSTISISFLFRHVFKVIAKPFFLLKGKYYYFQSDFNHWLQSNIFLFLHDPDSKSSNVPWTNDAIGYWVIFAGCIISTILFNYIERTTVESLFPENKQVQNRTLENCCIEVISIIHDSSLVLKINEFKPN